MRVRKTGDGLAVTLPDELVRALDIEEGDELQIETDGSRWRLTRSIRRRSAVATLQSLAVDPPPGFRFTRGDAHERDRD